METRASVSVVKWGLSAVGEAVLVGSVLSARRWYGPSGLLIWLALGTFPFIPYLMWIRSVRWSLVTGTALLAVAIWSSLSFALTPDGSRGGTEGSWFLFSSFLGCVLVGMGKLIDILFGTASNAQTP